MRTDPRAWLQRALCLVLIAGFAGATSIASLAQGAYSYWISMRGVAAEAQPSFVTVSPVVTTSHSVAFPGCHGRTWYLEPGAAAIVQSARAVGETVQIHRGASGSSPSGSIVICLIQADG
jgi:hypothetical protein